MKKLWKYLSTLGLMLVSCLCLGVGLKASEISFGAGGETHGTLIGGGTACVYIANGKHEMKGGTIGGKDYGVYISGGTFTMSGGTISNCSSYGVYLSSGTFNYSAGTISDEIYLASSKYITLTKAPTSTLKIRLSSTSSGTKVAYLSGISSLTSTQLSYLNVVNMPSGYKLEVSSGYVVLAQASTTTNYTVTFSAGSGGSVSPTSVSVPSGTTFTTSSNTLRFSNGTTVTATPNSGYNFDHWSSTSGTITSSRTIYAYFASANRVANVYLDMNYAYIPAELPDEQSGSYDYMDQYKYTFNELEAGSDFGFYFGEAMLNELGSDLLDRYGYQDSNYADPVHADPWWFMFAFYGKSGYLDPIVRRAYFFQELVGTSLLDSINDFHDNFAIEISIYDSNGGSYIGGEKIGVLDGMYFQLFQFGAETDIYIDLTIREEALEQYEQYESSIFPTDKYTRPGDNVRQHTIKILKDDYYNFSEEEITMLVGYSNMLQYGYANVDRKSKDDILQNFDYLVNSGKIQIDQTGIRSLQYDSGGLDSMYPDWEYSDIRVDDALTYAISEFYNRGYDLYFSDYLYYYSSLTMDIYSSVMYFPEQLSFLFDSVLHYYDYSENALEFNTLIRIGTLGNHKAMTAKYWNNYFNQAESAPDPNNPYIEKYYTRGYYSDGLDDTRLLDNRSELFIQSPIDLGEEMERLRDQIMVSYENLDLWAKFLQRVARNGYQIRMDIVTFIQAFCGYAVGGWHNDGEVLQLAFGSPLSTLIEQMKSYLSSLCDIEIVGYDTCQDELAACHGDNILEIFSQPRGEEYKNRLTLGSKTILMSTNLKWLNESAARCAAQARTSYTYMFNLMGIPLLGEQMINDFSFRYDRYESLYKFNFVLINNMYLQDSNNNLRAIAEYILRAQLASQVYANVFEDKYKYFDIFYSSFTSRTAQYAHFIQ